MSKIVFEKKLKISCCFIEKTTQKFVQGCLNRLTLNVPANISKPNAFGVPDNIHNATTPPNALITSKRKPEQEKKLTGAAATFQGLNNLTNSLPGSKSTTSEYWEGTVDPSNS